MQQFREYRGTHAAVAGPIEMLVRHCWPDMKRYHGSITRVEHRKGRLEGYERFLINIVKVAWLQSTDCLSFQVDQFTLCYKERHSTGTPANGTARSLGVCLDCYEGL